VTGAFKGPALSRINAFHDPDHAMNPIVVIPARMASTRLPGKPLADIHGKPMIVHVLERGREADIGPVAVACGDAEIAEAVRQAGGRAVLTDPDLPSGSDRVHAAMAELDPDGRHDVVVNLQGDVPTMDPRTLRVIVAPLENPAFDISTVVVPIQSDEEANTASFVKAACAFEAGQTTAPALYFSRQPIPWGDGPRWHHVGIYAYQRAALDRYVVLPPSPLERREHLEQLRALEAGMRIVCARLEHGLFGVDTPDDLARARALLAPGAGGR
jgi:3-deoxy-manno-octulosonate cytidylyltransferase (CMP-KDO synthetase)